MLNNIIMAGSQVLPTESVPVSNRRLTERRPSITDNDDIASANRYKLYKLESDRNSRLLMVVLLGVALIVIWVIDIPYIAQVILSCGFGLLSIWAIYDFRKLHHSILNHLGIVPQLEKFNALCRLERENWDSYKKPPGTTEDARKQVNARVPNWINLNWPSARNTTQVAPTPITSIQVNKAKADDEFVEIPLKD